MTSRTPAPRKKAVNVSINAALADEAKRFGTNLSATLEAALLEAHKARRTAEWRRENKSAVDAWNALIEEDGIWLDKYRG